MKTIFNIPVAITIVLSLRAAINTNGQVWKTNGSQVYLNPAYQKVGIGTASPTRKFHIEGTARTIMQIGGPANSDGAVGDISIGTGDNKKVNGITSWWMSFRTDDWSNDPGDLVFYNHNGTNYTAPLILQANGNILLGTGKNAGIGRKGNVGIGTLDPIYGKLQIQGTGIDNGITIYNPNQTTLRIWQENNIGYITRGPNGIALDSDGNVGIGTTPYSEYKLDVKGTLRLQDVNDPGSKYLIVGNDAFLTDINRGNIMGIYGNWDETVGGIQLGSNDGSYIFGKNGKIGIGISDPEQKLHVKGNIVSEGADFVLGKNDGRPQGDNKPAQRALVHAGWDNTADELIINYDGDFEDGVRIMGDQTFFHGQVGIGNLPPNNNYKLAVSGRIITDGVTVKLQSEWADYVFDEAYTLRSLQEVESFVKANGHLPGIPNAEQVQEDGVDLAEMNKLLLEKVEELTLYMIEMKKENQELKKEIETLKNTK